MVATSTTPSLIDVAELIYANWHIFYISRIRWIGKNPTEFFFESNGSAIGL